MLRHFSSCTLLQRGKDIMRHRETHEETFFLLQFVTNKERHDENFFSFSLLQIRKDMRRHLSSCSLLQVRKDVRRHLSSCSLLQIRKDMMQKYSTNNFASRRLTISPPKKRGIKIKCNGFLFDVLCWYVQVFPERARQLVFLLYLPHPPIRG